MFLVCFNYYIITLFFLFFFFLFICFSKSEDLYSPCALPGLSVTWWQVRKKRAGDKVRNAPRLSGLINSGKLQIGSGLSGEARASSAALPRFQVAKWELRIKVVTFLG